MYKISKEVQQMLSRYIYLKISLAQLKGSRKGLRNMFQRLRQEVVITAKFLANRFKNADV